MKFEVVAGDIGGRDTDAIVVNLFEGIARPGGATGTVDGALDGAITELIGDGEITGKRGEVTIIHTLGKIAPARVIVAGLGKASDFDAEAVGRYRARRPGGFRVSAFRGTRPSLTEQASAGWTRRSRPRPSSRGRYWGCTTSTGSSRRRMAGSRSRRWRSWSSTRRSWRRCS